LGSYAIFSKNIYIPLFEIKKMVKLVIAVFFWAGVGYLDSPYHKLHVAYQNLQISNDVSSPESVAAVENAVKDCDDQISAIEKIFSNYIDVTSKIIDNQSTTIKLYQDILETGEMFGGLLSISERSTITQEVLNAKKLFNLGIRESSQLLDITKTLNPNIFDKLLTDVQSNCPTIMNILEQLVLSRNISRNTKRTEKVKLKASVHLLASLMDVRDQKTHNDIPLLFGLLCICYGAGPSMIELLQHLGLSESYPVM